MFLWCGSSDGLDLGRLCLQNWGFRRCEDICWIRTNARNKDRSILDPRAVFCRSKEHCLMGIKGTVRRSTDGDFIHANVDIDLIIDEEPEVALGSYDGGGRYDLKVGERVMHDHFGAGVLEELVGSGANARATVRVARHGGKQLLLQYARLKVVGGGGAR